MFTLKDIYKINTKRNMVLLRGTYDLRTNQMNGEWEEISSPYLIISETELEFNSAVSPSASQSYTVYGKNTYNDLTIYPSENFKISTDNATWEDEIVIPQVNGEIPETTIYVRMKVSGNGSYTGKITHFIAYMDRYYIKLTGVKY